jgi:transcriptional regulator with XRE-family HTH domain
MAADPKANAAAFGRRLKEARDARNESLREIQRRSGLNSGYLSQLENGKIVHPSPSILQKVAAGYRLRFEDVLAWLGYVPSESSPVTPNQAVALSTVSALGDPSDDELQALKAIVEILQKSRSSPYTPPSDLPLDAETVAEVRRYTIALLNEAGALGERPTPLENVREAARLVVSGEITLDPLDRNRLVERFGQWVNVAWKRLQGAFDYRASAIWLAPGLHEMKRRFVLSHEIGHAILPAHEKTFAYIDDFTRLPPFARDLFEREANEAAVQILFQGGQATDEFDSSAPTLDEICRISTTFGASVISTARFVVETSRRPVAVALAHRRASGGLGPTHIYASPSFAGTFGWSAATAPPEARQALRTSFAGGTETWIVKNRRDEPRIANVDKMFTGYAAIALIVPESKTKAIGRSLRNAASAVRLPH